MPVITVARNLIYHAVADVGLISVHITMGCDGEGHGPCARGWADGYRADGCRPVGAHETGIEAHTRGGEQNPGG